MFVANRYYNSPNIAAASANLGDALFGSPQREYTRAQTEATQEQTIDRRLLRPRTQEEWDARMRAADAWRRSGIKTSPGEPDLGEALEILRRRARPGVDFSPPTNAAPAPRVAGVPPGIDPQAYAGATDFGRSVYDSNGPPMTKESLIEAMKASGHWPPDPALAAQQAAAEAEVRAAWAAEGRAPSSLMGQTGNFVGPLEEPRLPGQSGKFVGPLQEPAPAASPAASQVASTPRGAPQPSPDDLYAMLSAFTDQTPGRIVPEDQGAMLADMLLGFGADPAFKTLAAMQGQRNPYEELGVRALLGEQAGEIDFSRDLELAKLRGAYDLAGRARSRTGTGVPLDMTPAEYEKMMDLLYADDRLAGLEPAQMDALGTLVSQKYQRSRNFAASLDEALQESGLLGLEQPGWGGWPWNWGDEPQQRPWEKY
jgi:hypothetical protein